MARYGGEEFAILLRGIDLPTATTSLNEAWQPSGISKFHTATSRSRSGLRPRWASRDCGSGRQRSLGSNETIAPFISGQGRRTRPNRRRPDRSRRGLSRPGTLRLRAEPSGTLKRAVVPVGLSEFSSKSAEIGLARLATTGGWPYSPGPYKSLPGAPLFHGEEVPNQSRQ